MDSLPQEMQRYIFHSLPLEDILICRRVSKRWKKMVDDYTTEGFWKNRCAVEYSESYMEAKSKAVPGLTWRQLYKSLSLWSHLDSAKITLERVSRSSPTTHSVPTAGAQVSSGSEVQIGASHSRIRNTVGDRRNFHLLNVKNGWEMTILSGCNIICNDFINNDTKEIGIKIKSLQDILKYQENYNVIVFLVDNDREAIMASRLANPHTDVPRLDIYPKQDGGVNDRIIGIKGVTDFICVNNIVYYTRGGKVYRYDVNDKTNKMVIDVDDHILLSHKENSVIALCTDKRQLILYHEVSGSLTEIDFSGEENIVQMLIDYEFTKYIGPKNWRALTIMFYSYFDALYTMINKIVMDSRFFTISTLKRYGDIVIVGSLWGHILIYKKPYKHGKIDFTIAPIKTIKMYEVTTTWNTTICSIETAESNTGPVVIVSTAYDIFILKLSYVCEQTDQEVECNKIE